MEMIKNYRVYDINQLCFVFSNMQHSALLGQPEATTQRIFEYHECNESLSMTFPLTNHKASLKEYTVSVYQQGILKT